MHTVVTGAAGFIGANLVRALNDRGVTSVLAVAVGSVLLTACLGSMAMLELEQFGPQVGAIVVFKPGTERMDLWHVTASAASSLLSS